jgi:DNA-binding response OmpR family regulator
MNPSRATPTPYPAERRLRILLVEDYADAGESQAMLLRRAGFDVTVAMDGPSACAAARDQPPDVLLADLALPGMDGYQVAKLVCERCPVKPLVMAITGFGQEADRRRSRDEGFAYHFVKPVDPPELIAVLREHARSLAAVGAATAGSSWA